MSAHESSGIPEFFRCHGILTPGIRLFRVIGFPAKAAWVSAAFMVPIVTLGFSLWNAASNGIESSAKELLGTQYARGVIALLDAAQVRRRAATAAAPDLPTTTERVDAALNAVKDMEGRFGASFNTAGAFKAVDDLQHQLKNHPTADTPPATFAAHTAFTAAVLQLLADAADGSNLTLDPDLNSFYLMDATLFQRPLLVEQLAQLRGMGNAILRSGTLTAEQHDTLARALAFAETYQSGAEKSMRRAVAADPALAKLVDEQGTEAANRAFLQAVRFDLLGPAPIGDPAAYLAQANKAIELDYALSARMFQALDTTIQARVQRLRHALWMQIGASSSCVLLALYLLVSFYRVAQGGIAEIARHLTEISNGNLTSKPRPWGRDEAAMLMNTVARTIDALCSVVRTVRHSAGEIEVASTEIASASMDLSRRTEDTATHLQRTSAAMEQMTSSVSRTADTAAGAAQIVDANADVATRGGTIVGEVVTTMEGIRDASRRIANIISVIDGIAFQTNILALNAAVEAARAGEQGRGFAVVASEVRALAHRTAEAAREVKSLIGFSVERVESGTTVVGQAGSTMTDIVGNAARIKSLMAEISHAASEQSTGLADVSRSVQQLDTTTQQNAALVEESAAAAAALKDSAERLNQEVAYFRIA